MAFFDFPETVRHHVLSFSFAADAARAQVVSRAFRFDARDEDLWKQWCMATWRSPALRPAPCPTWRESWQHWYSTAYHYSYDSSYRTPKDKFEKSIVNKVLDGRVKDRQYNLDARVWLDAAATWTALESALAGTDIVRSLREPATQDEIADLEEELDVGYPIPRALQALWAVHNGQSLGADLAFDRRSDMQADEFVYIEHERVSRVLRTPSPNDEWRGIFGGFSCGGIETRHYHICSRLFSTSRATAWTLYFRRIRDERLDELPRSDPRYKKLLKGTTPHPPESIVIGASSDLKRIFVIHLDTCEVWVGTPSDWLVKGTLRRASPLSERDAKGKVIHNHRTGLGMWWSEFGRRVRTGVYGVSPLIPDRPETRGLCLFPRRPLGGDAGGAPGAATAAAAPTVCVFTSNEAHGVRVTASCINYVDQLAIHTSQAHVFSISLELLPSAVSGVSAPGAAAANLAAAEQAIARDIAKLARASSRSGGEDFEESQSLSDLLRTDESGGGSAAIGFGDARSEHLRTTAERVLSSRGCQLYLREWSTQDESLVGLCGPPIERSQYLQQNTRYPLLRFGGYRDDVDAATAADNAGEDYVWTPESRVTLSGAWREGACVFNYCADQLVDTDRAHLFFGKLTMVANEIGSQSFGTADSMLATDMLDCFELQVPGCTLATPRFIY